MTQFKVCIGQFEHRSEDDGKTWVRSLRQVPARYSPVMSGQMDIAHLPAGPPQCYWDYAYLSLSGFGVAVGHENVDQLQSVANLFVTTDGSGHWREQDPKNSLGLVRRAVQAICPSGPTWPIEKFASMAVSGSDSLALAWTDPGLFEDGARSHVISTGDRGATWTYHCLGETNPYLAADKAGRLLALNDGFFLESADAGTSWSRRDFQVVWPDNYRQGRVALLRQVTFVDSEIGYALVVHWPPTGNWAREAQPNIGLLCTNDNGNRWKHLHVFDGPDVGDVNERHVTSLQIF